MINRFYNWFETVKQTDLLSAKQSPQETFSRDATALWFLSWDEICVIISIIIN